MLWFDHFLDSCWNLLNFFVVFFGKFKTSKSHSEINWPLKKHCPDNWEVMMRMEQHTETRKCEPFYPVNQVSWKYIDFIWILQEFFKNIKWNSDRKSSQLLIGSSLGQEPWTEASTRQKSRTILLRKINLFGF